MRPVLANRDGYGLVELMVGVGILAAISMPKLQNFSAKANLAEVRSDVKNNPVEFPHHAEKYAEGTSSMNGVSSTKEKDYSVSHPTEPFIYIVKAGDTLSTIAQTHIGNPVFAKPNGSLFKLLKMNPTLDEAKLVFPGQRIVIRSSGVQELSFIDSGQNTQSEQPLSLVFYTINSQAPEFGETSRQDSPDGLKQIEIPHHLILDATMGMTTFTNTDRDSRSATLFSSQDFGVGIGWQQDWSDSFSTKFSGKFRSVEFEPPTDATKSVSYSKKSMTGLGLGAESKLSSNFSVNYGASYSQELFLRRETSSSVSVDTVAVPKFSVGAVYKIFEVGKTSIGVSGRFDHLSGVATEGYTVNKGTARQGGFYLKRRYGIDNSVKLNISYSDRVQNTSVVKSHERTVFGTLIFSFPLFNESENK